MLRQDESETREAFQVLCQYNISKSDLVPMIVTYPTETEIVYNARESWSLHTLLWPHTTQHKSPHEVDLFFCCAVKVLTYLTMPIDSASDNKMMQVGISNLCWYFHTFF